MGFCKRRAAEIIAEFDVARANKKIKLPQHGFSSFFHIT